MKPAWLLGKGAWRALRASGFAYTTTFSHFHCLGGGDEAGAGGRAVLSPSLVYAARNRGGRLLSPRVADATAAMLANAPLVRFSLHPPDARYPELVRHTQRMLERLLAQREAVTKAECARRLMLAQARLQVPADAGKVVLPIMGAAPVRSAGGDEPVAPHDTENKVGDQAGSGNEADEAVDGKAASEYAEYGDGARVADTATLPDVATPAAVAAAPVDVSAAAPVAEAVALAVVLPAAAPVTAAVSAPALDAAPQAAPDTEEIVTEAVSAPASPPGATGSPHRVVPSFARLPDGAADATSASPTSRRPSGRSRRRHSSASRNAATHPSH
jgi:hypothetical protein